MTPAIDGATAAFSTAQLKNTTRSKPIGRRENHPAIQHHILRSSPKIRDAAWPTFSGRYLIFGILFLQSVKWSFS
jgi:hypothetical protein